jgi:drug/metabolite transporter (DMT)-like permease
LVCRYLTILSGQIGWLYYLSSKASPKLRSSEVGWSSLYGATNGIAGALYVISIYLSNNISIVTAIAALSLPLLAIAAHFVLKERDNPKLLWGGVTLAFVGLLVLALG